MVAALYVQTGGVYYGLPDVDPWDEAYHSAQERRRAVRRGVCERLSARERGATPPEFRDVLLAMARSYDH